MRSMSRYSLSASSFCISASSLRRPVPGETQFLQGIRTGVNADGPASTRVRRRAGDGATGRSRAGGTTARELAAALAEAERREAAAEQEHAGRLGHGRGGDREIERALLWGAASRVAEDPLIREAAERRHRAADCEEAAQRLVDRGDAGGIED